MNFFQQVGLAGFLGGIVLTVIRYWKGEANALVAQLPIGGETVGVILPPDWVILAFLAGGLLLLALGTVWRGLHREGNRGAEE